MGFPGGIGRWKPVCGRAKVPLPWRARKGWGKEQNTSSPHPEQCLGALIATYKAFALVYQESQEPQFLTLKSRLWHQGVLIYQNPAWHILAV